MDFFACISNLDSAPVAPINMQDWQLQQKALKDKDRMSKTDAEAMLHGYRGMDEAQSKLSSIKQEDRKGKQDAERLLRNYRAGLDALPSPSKKNKNPNRESGAPMYTANDDEVNTEAGVSVADLAASYNHPRQENDMVTGTCSAARKAPNEGAGAPESPGGSSDSGIMVDSPTQTKNDGGVPKAEASSEDWVAVDTSDAPLEEVARAAELVVPEPQTSESSTAIDSGEVQAVLTARSSPTPEPVRMDVEFRFGLLFSDYIPNVDKYMSATAEIVGSIPSVFYNPAFGPFVRDVQEDSSFMPPHGQTGSKKCIVRASVPVFVMPGGDTSKAQAQVWTGLRDAIDNGTFLDLAKRH